MDGDCSAGALSTSLPPMAAGTSGRTARRPTDDNGPWCRSPLRVHVDGPKVGPRKTARSAATDDRRGRSTSGVAGRPRSQSTPTSNNPLRVPSGRAARARNRGRPQPDRRPFARARRAYAHVGCCASAARCSVWTTRPWPDACLCRYPRRCPPTRGESGLRSGASRGSTGRAVGWSALVGGDPASPDCRGSGVDRFGRCSTFG